jgi:hypothetical protein
MAQFDKFEKKIKNFIYIFIYIVPDNSKSNLEKSILICFLCSGFPKKFYFGKTAFFKLL